jgi:phosphoglycolate phosphatase-like HAD superfamily hydrolase
MAERLRQRRFTRLFHIGDTPSDVIAAHEAGFEAIAVRTNSAHYDSFPEPCFVFQDLEVGLDDILALLK